MEILQLCKLSSRKRSSFWRLCLYFGAALFGCGRFGYSYTIVTISTAAPQGLERSFLAATTNQFLATVTANPLAANTYAVKLFAPNPAYNAPPSTLEQALSLGSTIYVYGWADGQSYQQHVHHNLVETYMVNCSTPIGFATSTWDISTCQAVTGAIDEAIFQESLSTPTVVPGGF